MFMRLIYGGVTALILSVGAACATTFTFDDASTGWQSNLNYSEDGINLEVTGRSTNGAAAKVATWDGYGLGVCNEFENVFGCPSILDQHGVDSFLVLEDVAVFTFDKAVELTKIVFNNLGNSNTFDLYLDDGGWTEVLTAEPAPGTYVPSDNYTSLVFGVGAGTSSYQVRSCSIFGCRMKTITDYSAFKIRSIDVEMSPVPLPASSLMLLAGVGGLAAMRRRQKKNKS